LVFPLQVFPSSSLFSCNPDLLGKVVLTRSLSRPNRKGWIKLRFYLASLCYHGSLAGLSNMRSQVLLPFSLWTALGPLIGQTARPGQGKAGLFLSTGRSSPKTYRPAGLTNFPSLTGKFRPALEALTNDFLFHLLFGKSFVRAGRVSLCPQWSLGFTVSVFLKKRFNR